MNSKITNKEKNTVTLEITVDKEKFAEAMERSYKKNAKKIAIPGFRKGKAPRKFIEKYYGEGIFYEDAINEVCPDAYDEAVKDNSLEPVDRPEIDIVSLKKDEDFVFSAKVTCKPEFDLPEYKGVKLDKIEHKVLKADVTAEIDRMREQNARIVTVDNRAVKKGDIAIIDYEGFVNDVPFEGGKGENYNLEIGSGQFIPGFEDQIIGKKTGAEFDVNVTFPEDYHAEELKGKEAVFKVKLNEIKKKELPAKDDEFAKDVSEFDTLEELEADVKNKLKEAAKIKTQREKEDKILEIIAEKTEIDIPHVMIHEEIDRMIQEFSYNLSQQGLTLEQYAKFTGTTVESLQSQFHDSAEKRVKGRLILEAIAKAEKIEATEEDVENELKKMADNYGMELDKIKNIMAGSLDNMKAEIASNKVLDFLVEKSVTNNTAKKGVTKNESGTGSSGANK